MPLTGHRLRGPGRGGAIEWRRESARTIESGGPIARGEIMRAIIIGGGIGGLTAAIALRRAGIEAQAFEAREEVEKVQLGTGLSIWGNAMGPLRKLGLGDEIESRGSRMEWIEQRSSKGRVLARFPIGQAERKSGVPTINVTRADLHAALAGAVDTGTLSFGYPCTGFEQDGEGVTAHFADAPPEDGDLLLGADGINSVVRAQLLGDEKPRYAGYAAYRGLVEFEHELAPRGTFEQLLGCGSRFFWYHVNDRQLYWLGVVNARAGDRDPEGGMRERLLERFRGWPEPTDQIIEATAESAILRTEIYDRPPSERWGEGRVTLIGDAAHAMTFNVGQGACQAIEGAVLLADLVAEGSEPQAALRAYEAQRMNRTAAMIDRAWRMGKISQWRNPLLCALRNRFWKQIVERIGGGGTRA
jgi:2-polyprenyl-6-methoxyphenol hydroxylase-like FAD-dependent oxidoreductase